MASNLISRLLPVTDTARSIYETLRQDEDDPGSPDIEQRAGQALDEQNLGHRFQDIDPEDLQLNASHVTAQSRLIDAEAQQKRSRESKPLQNMETEDADDEVPASLLIEGHNLRSIPQGLGLAPHAAFPNRPIPIGGNASKATQDHWEATQRRQSLYPPPPTRNTRPGRPGPELQHLSFADRRQKAMWRWANVENLDIFLTEVYIYYLGNGFLSTMLQRTLQLLTFAFVAGFTIFLASCVNYDNLRPSGRLSQVLVHKCASHMSGGSSLAIWVVSFLWVIKLFQYILDIRRLRNLHDFYQHLLGISDGEIQSISWQEIVSRLMALRDANPTTATVLPALHRRFLGSQSKQRMDAHDIANRLMRKENYLIALFNKDVLDLTLHLPFIGKRQLFSRTLEWNINQCVMDYVFNEHGQVRPLFLKDTHRKALSDGLRRRFKFAGTLNIFVAPFLVTYFLVHYFFSYFTEYQRNPSQIGSRHYNPLAEWKFREFNELWHLFQRRINMSYPFASRYIDQFPKDKTVQLSRFVAFVAGALASVLAVASVVDPEMFLNFEISKDRSVIFYLGVFGSIWAVARGLLPEENLVYEPEFALQEVIDFTHYKPAHWEGRLHSDDVRKEFATLYQLKLLIFLEEILSMIFTPFVLWFSLPNCSDRIIDFFREFTVHVDGLGYVCSFAEFNFKKHGYTAQPQPDSSSHKARAGAASGAGQAGQDLREDYYATKNQKLEASYWGFMNDYARNPKTDIRFPYAASRRRFYPPPPFPGPLSPPLPTDRPNQRVTGYRQDHLEMMKKERGPAHHALGHCHKTDGPSKAGDVKATGPRRGNGSSSLVASVLLDAHHQPATTGFSQLDIPRPDDPKRIKHHPYPKSPEAEQTGEINNELRDYREQDTESSKEGILGSSWGLQQDGVDSGEEEDVDAIVGDTRAGGVLGMIKQFQKVQGEARGAP
jgi:autophagy-related protein 9